MSEDLAARARALVERTTNAQQLPATVEDPATIARVAAVVHARDHAA